MRQQSPDIFLVVLDCVRASDFPGDAHAVRPTPTFDLLREQSTSFARCAAASSWTIPSHVSLLTGLYPHELDAFSAVREVIPPTTVTLAETLREADYATCLISANHNLRPSRGITRGFDRTLWARWGVTSLKLGLRDDHPFDESDDGQVDRMRVNLLEQSPSGPWKVAAKAADLLTRYPAALYGVSRVIQAVRDPERAYDDRAAPWIESEFEKWIRSIPREKPVFTVLNFMDCHEPYLLDLDHFESIGEWWRLARQRQDVTSWARGVWKPSEVELRTLHELYRKQIRVLDRRIAVIIDTIAEAKRWEDCMFVLTSDHGQAFGEGANLFHGTSTEDAVVRVPLWVKWPKSRWAGKRSDSWTSSVDIPPSILSELQIEVQRDFIGKPLQELLNAPRGDAVYSVTERLLRASSKPNRQHRRFAITGFFGSERVTLEGEQLVGASKAPSEVIEQLHIIANKLADTEGQGVGQDNSPSISTLERLQSWGYV